jgi:hypothetical protein
VTIGNMIRQLHAAGESLGPIKKSRIMDFRVSSEKPAIGPYGRRVQARGHLYNIRFNIVFPTM